MLCLKGASCIKERLVFHIKRLTMRLLIESVFYKNRVLCQSAYGKCPIEFSQHLQKITKPTFRTFSDTPFGHFQATFGHFQTLSKKFRTFSNYFLTFSVTIKKCRTFSDYFRTFYAPPSDLLT